MVTAAVARIYLLILHAGVIVCQGRRQYMRTTSQGDPGASAFTNNNKPSKPIWSLFRDNPSTFRPYMKCLIPMRERGRSRPLPLSPFVIEDDLLQVSLDLDCLMKVIPEEADRDVDTRFPVLLRKGRYHCEEDDDRRLRHQSASGASSNSGDTICQGRVGPLLLDCAFSRDSPEEEFTKQQYAMQEDLAYLCLFYERQEHQQECLATYRSWRYFSQKFDDKARPHQSDLLQLRESVIRWAFLESDDFLSGHLFRETDRAREEQIQSWFEAAEQEMKELRKREGAEDAFLNQYYEELGKHSFHGDILKGGIRDQRNNHSPPDASILLDPKKGGGGGGRGGEGTGDFQSTDYVWDEAIQDFVVNATEIMR